mgnify:CR=1 FL=1
MPLNFNDFGIDCASMAGSLETRLAAARQSGFTHAMIAATDIVGHPANTETAVRTIRDSGLRVTGLEALRDFEGLSGKLHEYKVDVAKSMLELCSRIGGRLLLTNNQGELLEVSVTDGKVIRKTSLPAATIQAPVVAGETLYLLTEDGDLVAYR